MALLAAMCLSLVPRFTDREKPQQMGRGLVLKFRHIPPPLRLWLPNARALPQLREAALAELASVLRSSLKQRR